MRERLAALREDLVQEHRRLQAGARLMWPVRPTQMRERTGVSGALMRAVIATSGQRNRLTHAATPNVRFLGCMHMFDVRNVERSLKHAEPAWKLPIKTISI